MKTTRIRTAIAASVMGAIAVTGVFAVSAAGAQTADQTTQAAQGKGAFFKSLTAEQRSCLQSNGVVKPDHTLTAEERAAAKATIQAAAQTCGVTLPERPAIAKMKELRAELKSLTPEQRACLQSNGATRPDHKLTKEERQAAYAALEAAAQTCGIAIS